MNGQTQILIVGAGPTGLTLAIHLLRLGMRVRLIDKKTGPSVTSKAIGLQYRVSEILACMGIVDRFLARGGTPTTVNISIGTRRLVRLNFQASGKQSGRNAFAPKAIVIPQSETEKILGDLVREQGGEIEWDTEFLEFREIGAGVMSRVRRGNGRDEEFASEWLVSCEGAHSAIRQQAGIAFAGKTYPLAFFLADVELSGPLRHGENYVWMHRDGSFAALPMPKPGAWRLFVDVTQRNARAGEEISLDLIRELMAERVGNQGITVTNPTWISDFRIHCRMVDRYRAGRALIAGDAAHVHSPAGGQGIVTGIQDATNLAWKLARVVRGAPGQLLDTYEEERLPKAQEVLRETDRTTRVLLAPTILMRLVRDLLLLPVMRMPWVQKKLFAKLAQLHVQYRGSSLSQDQDAARWSARSLLRAGDRAPDVAFQERPGGGIITLFKLLEPMRPVILIGAAALTKDEPAFDALQRTLAEAEIDVFVLRETRDAKETEARCLWDLHGDFQRLYGMSGDFLCLIRPDDHIGLFQRPTNERALREYVSRLAPAPRAVKASTSAHQPIVG